MCAAVASAAVLFETVTPTSVARVHAVAECLATAQPLTEAFVPFEVPAPVAPSVLPVNPIVFV